jgi:hypothetical protein
MVKFHILDEVNFEDFYCLLLKRGCADKDYYRWKYLKQPDNKSPTGIIAYENNVPCGCIGIINRTYFDSNGNCHDALWFADWFVDSAFRGKNIGFLLQREILSYGSAIMGITNPITAQLIARKVGYSTSLNFYLINGVVNVGKCKRRFKSVISLKMGVKLVLNNLYIKTIFRSKINSYKILNFKEIYEHMSLGDSVSSFKLDEKYLDWIFKMPLNFQRDFYLCIIQGSKFLIAIDTNSEKTKTMKVFFSEVINQNGMTLRKYCMTCYSIAKYFSAIYFEFVANLGESSDKWILRIIGSAQPFQSHSEVITGLNPNISLIDKESSWIDVKINN